MSIIERLRDLDSRALKKGSHVDTDLCVMEAVAGDKGEIA